MFACVDVDYRAQAAVAACVTFQDWSDSRPSSEKVIRIDQVEPYEPGQFFRRELPCLLAVLGALERHSTVQPEPPGEESIREDETTFALSTL